MLELKNVTKEFGTKKAVNNLNFRLDSGKILGLVGRNGAGKSTTFRMILQIIERTIEVKEGDVVRQGQTVLKVGSTGYSTGPHAHFEIRINGEYLNPADYVSPFNGQEQELENITVLLN